MQATAIGIPMDLCNEKQPTFQTKKGFNQQNFGPSTGPSGTEKDGKSMGYEAAKISTSWFINRSKITKKAPDLTNLTSWKKQNRSTWI